MHFLLNNISKILSRGIQLSLNIIHSLPLQLLNIELRQNLNTFRVGCCRTNTSASI